MSLLRLPVRLRHPAQVIVVAFAAVILVGTALLALPVASADGTSPGFVTALFTATSAVCVTGLVVVDTPTAWSNFGHTVILVLFQIGGFGIMTFASLLALISFRRFGLRRQMMAQTETGSLQLGDLRRLVISVAFITVVVEVVTAVLLTARFATTYGEPFGRAVWLGLFHAVSAFNNAGFALYSNSLMEFAKDPVITLSVAVAVIIGGLGFPVLLELRMQPSRPHYWSVHTKLTLVTSAFLLVAGTVALLFFEWTNPATLGPLDNVDKVQDAFFSAAASRTAGFNTLDYSLAREATWVATAIMMFIGGGPASTAGGIKVTTFALLGYVIWAELRGEPDVNVFGRRVPTAVQRQALAVALLGIVAVAVGILWLLTVADLGVDRTLFEVVSAFGTVGLSTGITALVPDSGALLLTALMFVGRLGPVTLGAALAVRTRDRLYRLPEERPIIG